MTILPKLKSGAGPKKSASRDSPNATAYEPQGVVASNSGPGWVPGSSSQPAWSPSVPQAPGPTSSSSRWVSPSGSSSSSGVGQEGNSNPKKRPSSSQSQGSGSYFSGFEDRDIDLKALSTPTSTKRSRHRAVATMTVVRNNSGGPAASVGSSGVVRPDEDEGPHSPPEASTSGTGEGGYNSEDEYSHLGVQLTDEEWAEKDRRFEKAMKKKGYIIKKMNEDGSCLFRAVADQIYGDQEMHPCVRTHCMDYIEQNSDYFSQYVTEGISDYVERKRFLGVHGNHLEIQALSEMYNRPIHIYCYSIEPINIFQAMDKTDHHINAPIRLCYHRGVHYNSLVDPYKATIGVGLGLPNHSPGSADRNLLGQAVRLSEEGIVEKKMLEDKIRATDWEATNEAIEEQVARESYLQWLRDNERRNTVSMERGTSQKSTTSATVTSGELRASPPTPKEASRQQLQQQQLQQQQQVVSNSVAATNSSPSGSPKPSCSSTSSFQKQIQNAKSPEAGCSSGRDSPQPGSSSSQTSQTFIPSGSDFRLLDTATFLNGLPPTMFGLDNWGDTDVLTQVLAVSQQEYLDTLKKNQQKKQEEDHSDAAAYSEAERPGNGGSLNEEGDDEVVYKSEGAVERTEEEKREAEDGDDERRASRELAEGCGFSPGATKHQDEKET